VSLPHQPKDRKDASPLGSSRYELLVKLASGGMATVYVGRIRGAVGFTRLVAIKRAHTHLLEKPAFKQMLVDEARLASHIHHPNVVAVQDVEEFGNKLHLVMDYVEGASLAELIALGGGAAIPPRVAVRIALDAAAGLQAAHELTDEDGELLRIVHRDVSPHNILLGVDGMARIADFGIAKFSRSRVKTTTGSLKGKVGYMAPEYIDTGTLDARGDVFSLGVVVWEMFANRRLFRGATEVESLKKILAGDVPALTSVVAWMDPDLDDVLMTALDRSPAQRFATAGAFGKALEAAARGDDLIGSHGEVGAFVKRLVSDQLAARRARINEVVRTNNDDTADPSSAPARSTEPSPRDDLDDAKTTRLEELAPSAPNAEGVEKTATMTRIEPSAAPESGEVPPAGSLEGSGLSSLTRASIAIPLRRTRLWPYALLGVALLAAALVWRSAARTPTGAKPAASAVTNGPMPSETHAAPNPPQAASTEPASPPPPEAAASASSSASPRHVGQRPPPSPKASSRPPRASAPAPPRPPERRAPVDDDAPGPNPYGPKR
jgi:eukaryotic-like serine/threonine-protein kinase